MSVKHLLRYVTLHIIDFSLFWGAFLTATNLPARVPELDAQVALLFGF